MYSLLAQRCFFCLLLPLLTLICSISLAGTPRPQKVWLLAGQSNMIGYGTRNEDLPPALRQPQAGVKISTDGRSWVDLAPGLGPTRDSFGLELTFGRELAAAFPEVDILLVKRMVMGDLYTDYRSPNAGRGPAGAAYNHLVALAKAALASKPGAEIAGVLYMQGEADAHTDKIEATSYEQNLRRLVESLRTDLASPEMPFVIGQISKAKIWVYGDIVRQAQANVAQTQPHCALVDTGDLPLGDGMHYTSEGHMELGRRFAQKAISLEKARRAGGPFRLRTAPGRSTGPRWTRGLRLAGLSRSWCDGVAMGERILRERPSDGGATASRPGTTASYPQRSGRRRDSDGTGSPARAGS